MTREPEHGATAGTRGLKWPGDLRFTIAYDGLADPVIPEAPGVNLLHPDQPAPARALLNGLRGDLGNRDR